jgi:hypothetical protein
MSESTRSPVLSELLGRSFDGVPEGAPGIIGTHVLFSTAIFWVFPVAKSEWVRVSGPFETTKKPNRTTRQSIKDSIRIYSMPPILPATTNIINFYI